MFAKSRLILVGLGMLLCLSACGAGEPGDEGTDETRATTSTSDFSKTSCVKAGFNCASSEVSCEEQVADGDGAMVECGSVVHFKCCKPGSIKPGSTKTKSAKPQAPACKPDCTNKCQFASDGCPGGTCPDHSGCTGCCTTDVPGRSGYTCILPSGPDCGTGQSCEYQWCTINCTVLSPNS
jgi:hypothetical protein